MTLFDYLFTLECITFIITLIYLKKLVHAKLLFIPILLFIIFFSEVVTIIAREYPNLLKINNTIWFKEIVWYNIMIPCQFICYFMLFHVQTKVTFWKRMIELYIITTVLLTILYFYNSNLNDRNILGYTIEVTFLSSCCLHYLFECMTSTTIIDVHKTPLVYVAFGTLLFYLGTLPLHTMWNYLYINHNTIFYTYFYLFYVLNYIMYGLISFGILWAQKK